jgi:hypothetical protein
MEICLLENWKSLSESFPSGEHYLKARGLGTLFARLYDKRNYSSTNFDREVSLCTYFSVPDGPICIFKLYKYILLLHIFKFLMIYWLNCSNMSVLQKPVY